VEFAVRSLLLAALMLGGHGRTCSIQLALIPRCKSNAAVRILLTSNTDPANQNFLL